ncbi:MAG: DUF1573 domain-containing protein [Marinifilaceae bacterium]
MRYIISILFVCYMLCSCQHSKSVITANVEEQNLGEISDNESPKVIFKLFNSSTEDIEIEKISHSVSYLRLMQKPLRIKALDSAELIIQLNTPEIEGDFAGLTEVYFKGENSVLNLVVKGTLSPTPKDIVDICTSPFGPLMLDKSTWHIDEALIGEIYRDTIRIFNPTSQAIKVKAYSSDNVTCTVPFLQLMAGKASHFYLEYQTTDAENLGRKVDVVRFMMDDEKDNPTQPFVIDAHIKQNFSKMTEQERQKAPRLKLESYEFDFGTIQAGKEITRSLNLTNIGHSPLIVKKIITSCGCTTLDLPKKVIVPNETIALDVLFKSGGRSGLQQKSITVITNDPIQSEIKIIVKGNVKG